MTNDNNKMHRRKVRERSSARAKTRIGSGLARGRYTFHGGSHVGKDGRKVTTLFVDNLPKTMSLDWFKLLFKYYSDMEGTYLSKKKRMNTNNVFGFVRFVKKEDASRAIEQLTVPWSRIAISQRTFKGMTRSIMKP